MFNESEVTKGIQEFNGKMGAFDDAIHFLTNKNKHNQFYHVFAVVTLINLLYSTQIQNVHIESISKYIVDLEKNEGLSMLIKEANPLAVKKIANTKDIIALSNYEH